MTRPAGDAARVRTRSDRALKTRSDRKSGLKRDRAEEGGEMEDKDKQARSKDKKKEDTGKPAEGAEKQGPRRRIP